MSRKSYSTDFKREAVKLALSSGLQDELRRLRRENKILKEERDLLKKATAFFASQK